MPCRHVTSVHHKKKKKVCDSLVVSVSGRVLSTPGRAHMQMPTHTFKNHNASCINPNAVKHIRAHRHRITQRARGGWGGVCPDLWVPSQRGCCSASYNRTTDSLCSSCKFCSLSFGAQKSSVLSCEKDEGEGRRGGEWKTQEKSVKSEAAVCVRTSKSLRPHEGPRLCALSFCVTFLRCMCAKKKKKKNRAGEQWCFIAG